ncbi:hypothetical protein HK405_015064, partial [Cladochytrium tenue]
VWTQGAKRVVQFDPRVGRISDLFVLDSDEDRLIVASMENGLISLCNASTGKTDRDQIYIDPDRVPMTVP